MRHISRKKVLTCAVEPLLGNTCSSQNIKLSGSKTFLNAKYLAHKHAKKEE